MTNQKQRPAHEIRIGSVKATIWANRSEKAGMWYCVTFTRLYKVAGQWKRTSGFGINELPTVSRLADDALRWVQQQGGSPAQIVIPIVTQPTV
jgi:hypothetical protein